MNTAPNIEKKPNQTITMKIYISAIYSDYDQKFHYSVDSYDTTKYSKECVAIGTQEIEVVVPHPDNLINPYIQGLKAKQDDIRAEMHEKIEEVQERINRVLALEYIPADEDSNIPF